MAGNKSITSNIRIKGVPLKTAEGNQADIDAFRLNLIGSGNMLPIVMWNTDTKKYVMWDANIQEFRSLKDNKMVVPFTFDGTYTTSSTTFGTVPLNLLIPSKANPIGLDTNFIKASIFIDAQVTGTATGEARLIDSSGANIVTFGIANGGFAQYGSGHFNLNADTYNIQIRRVGGGIFDDVDIRGAALILEFTDRNEI